MGKKEQLCRSAAQDFVVDVGLKTSSFLYYFINLSILKHLLPKVGPTRNVLGFDST